MKKHSSARAVPSMRDYNSPYMPRAPRRIVQGNARTRLIARIRTAFAKLRVLETH